MSFSHFLFLLVWSPLSVAAQRDLVAPGTLVRGGGSQGARRGGWGVVGNWPEGFFIAGSSIREMNGLYERIARDNTLPHRSHIVWGNVLNGWLIANVDATLGYDSPALGHQQMEWLLIDPEGVERFAHEGGKYLPGAGVDWHHFHDLNRQWGGQWNKGRLRTGDKVRTHDTLRDDIKNVLFWRKGEEGIVTDARLPTRETERQNPVTWRRDSDGREFDTPAWHIRRIGGASPFIGSNGKSDIGGVNGSDTFSFRKEDLALIDPQIQRDREEAELPWQVVAIMSAERMAEYSTRYRDFGEEISAAKKLHSHQEHTRRKRKAKESTSNRHAVEYKQIEELSSMSMAVAMHAPTNHQKVV